MSTTTHTHHLSQFLQHRAHCFGLAYRMVGSKSDAEDILQEAYERWHQQDLDAIDNSEAFLTTMVSRLAIDHLRKHNQREHYTGQWLPEPLYGDALAEAGPFDTQSTYQSLSIAFLLLLEQLSPSERAVFLLRETFEYSYQEIANAINKTPDNCRQIFRRAKQRVAASDTASSIDAETLQRQQHKQQQLLNAFIGCFGQADQTQFSQLLAEDICLLADGGGKVPSVLRPLHGQERIYRYFAALRKRIASTITHVDMINVNHQKGVLITTQSQERTLMTLTCSDATIDRIFIIRNPDKLP